MADFEKAVEWLKEGKKVRIASWSNPEPLFIHLDKDGDIRIGNESYEWGGFYKFKLIDFETFEWDLFKKRDDWNWLKYHNSNNYTKKQLVEKLKQKLLEDVKSTTKDRRCFAEAMKHNPETERKLSRKEIEEIINKRFGF